ncbi:alpha/beta hydrolase [Clostridium sp. CF011]|uniref:alpha/beta fold hydrolase n=1 Tax=Clostridium sp. CF011 TaxID=2843318 RepID=UPI001C0CEA22|nr:alpha/beta hydrolase [Clostridium sp. CF011]MBU3091054.1 alpha/beta hydrolase [Clostridium sp. CF011]WAG69028.1 alpha/beta hydrolase [Clostridium sp. CF011]
MFSIVIGTIIGLLLIMLFILWLWGPGKVESYLDENGNVLEGSVSEIARVEIGGLEQGMIIKGKKDTNPVLLFLHGGPGNPEYVLAKEYNINLEDYFTVCWWEQRGSGMSYSSSIEKGSITLDQMIFDTVEVTNYLRERFGKEKIYIMGHSWGSFLGINSIDRYPELYEAYLGIGQVVNQFESEKLGYELMLSTAEANGDEKSIKNLKKFTLNTPEDITTDYLMVRSSIMNEQGYGVFHMPKSKCGLLMPIFKAKEYTIKDKYGYAAGSLLSLEQPMNHSINITNLNETIKELKVPVYIFHGIYDKQVSYDIALKYYEGLKAPKKQFYKFENSAHSPFMEEVDKFMGIIKEDILQVYS